MKSYMFTDLLSAADPDLLVSVSLAAALVIPMLTLLIAGVAGTWSRR